MCRNNDFIYEATSKLEQLIHISKEIYRSGQSYDALKLIGKKCKLKREDFNQTMLKTHIPEKAFENLWKFINNDKTLDVLE